MVNGHRNSASSVSPTTQWFGWPRSSRLMGVLVSSAARIIRWMPA
jgi:hypothetical protein